MNITIEVEGRRCYIVGNTFPIKDAIKAMRDKFGQSYRYRKGITTKVTKTKTTTSTTIETRSPGRRVITFVD